MPSSDEKVNFDRKSKHTMDGYFQMTSTHLKFRIDAPVVEILLSALFFTSMDDEEQDGKPITNAKLLKLIYKEL